MGDARAQFDALSKGAFLDVLLPRDLDLDAAGILKSETPEAIGQVSSRRTLFFDELVTVYLILRTATSADDVRKLLPSLEVVLAAHATDAAPQGAGATASPAAKHDVASKISPAVEVTEVIQGENQAFAIWKLTMHLPRPRARMQKPAVYLTAHLTISHRDKATSRKPDESYLKPFEPLPENVLAPLNFAPEFKNKDVYLSANRVTKVAPDSGSREDDIKPIRGASKRAFPAVPALFTSIKYTIVPDGVIASLHIESSRSIAGKSSIQDVNVTIPDGHSSAVGQGKQASHKSSVVQDLTTPSWPKELQAGDELILLYKLNERQATAEQPTALNGLITIAVSIVASGTLDQGSKVKLEMESSTQVDISQKIQPSEYRWSKTTDLQLPSQGESKKTASSNDSGVTFLISAPPTTHRGAEFQTKVQCINKSKRIRRFSLSMIFPEIRPNWHHSEKKTKPKVDGASIMADLLSAPRVQPQKAPSVELESGNIKLGPIEAGASDETWIKMRAVTTGVLDLGILRITDLDDQQMVEIRELPDVISLESEDGSEADI